MGKPLHKVLLVDDSEIVRDVVKALLEEQGLEVVALDSPAGLSRTMALEKPDVVLVDVSMPALSGDKLVEIALRSGLHPCPMVLFSDRTENELAALAAECGAAGYIRKTQDGPRLALQIKRVVHEYRRARGG